jgi:hypothetical protein
MTIATAEAEIAGGEPVLLDHLVQLSLMDVAGLTHLEFEFPWTMSDTAVPGSTPTKKGEFELVATAFSATPGNAPEALFSTQQSDSLSYLASAGQTATSSTLRVTLPLSSDTDFFTVTHTATYLVDDEFAAQRTGISYVMLSREPSSVQSPGLRCSTSLLPGFELASFPVSTGGSRDAAMFTVGSSCGVGGPSSGERNTSQIHCPATSSPPSDYSNGIQCHEVSAEAHPEEMCDDPRLGDCFTYMISGWTGSDILGAEVHLFGSGAGYPLFDRCRFDGITSNQCRTSDSAFHVPARGCAAATLDSRFHVGALPVAIKDACLP